MPYRERACAVCGTGFQPYTSRALCCSKICRNLRYAARSNDMRRRRYAGDAEHRGKILGATRVYRDKNRQRIRGEDRARYAANPQRQADLRLLNLRRFGLTLDQYEAMEADQGGVCAICAKPQTERHQNGKVKRLVVDHCHPTEKVRGLLCGRCNRAIGLLDEDRSLLLAAVSYLDRHQPQLKVVV